ncbi:MAG: cyclase/dehydrase [Solirubrobacterales bacterium]|nr:cyclase/dehydrase [Solirubrobacterales bacterium]
MAPNTDEKGAAELGREAFAQFRDAARYGAKALAERKAARGASGGGTDLKKEKEDKPASVKDRLPVPHTGGGAAAELGELADAALARFGKKGKLASKMGVGHRLVNRLLPEPEEEPDEEPDAPGAADDPGGADEPGGDEHLFDASTPIPIQESIDVAVPVAAAFDLCMRFEELPRFSDRIEEVDVEDDTHLTVLARIGSHRRTLGIEIVGEEPEERLDWDGVEGIEHSGVVTFHPLAPRLTRVEVTIEQTSERLRERFLRSVGMPERTVRRELRRFKAYAELWDEANDFKSADLKDPASVPPEEDIPEDEEPEDEADLEEEPDEEADEPLEDEEAEPAAQG